jgi:hypothetical protein
MGKKTSVTTSGMRVSQEKRTSSGQAIDRHVTRGGPRTPKGKSRSRGNARRHGIFSSELTLSDQERREFNQLESQLRNDLKPATPLCELLFDNLLTSAWQMKRSFGAVQATLNDMMAESGATSLLGDGADSPMYFPYALTASEIRRRLRMLKEFRAEVEKRHYIPPEWEKPITEALGADLWKTLSDWAPSSANHVAAGFAAVVMASHEVYGTSLPGTPPTPEESRKYRASYELAKEQMFSKLTAQEAQHLTLALRWAEHAEQQPAVQRNARLDLFLRYQTTTTRAFYRALEEYRKATAESNGSRSNCAFERDG